MSDRRLQAGMTWVATRLTGLGHGQSVAISPLGWDADTVNLQTHRHLFVLLLNGRREVLSFDNADLKDLPGDPRLQIQVEWELKALLNDSLNGSPLPV